MAEQVSRRSIIYDILVDFKEGKKSADEAASALGEVEQKAEGVTGTLKGVKAAFAAAIGAEVTRRLIQISKELLAMGMQAEGVNRAFKKLNNATLLNELRKATRGTVNDLTLMTAAVRADKFKIPLNQLASLLKFAQQRARDTGQEVNFLVNSIIDGLGKKSTQVLDNLGLSAGAIQQEFKKTGDFATAVVNIINRDLAATGDVLDLHADRIERAKVAWENAKQSAADYFLEIVGKGLERSENQAKVLEDLRVATEHYGITLEGLISSNKGYIIASEKGLAVLAKYKKEVTDVRAKQEEFKRSVEESHLANVRQIEGWIRNGEEIKNFDKALDELGAEMDKIASGKGRGNLGILNAELSELVKRFTDTNDPIKFNIQQLKEYQAQLEALQMQLEELGKTYVKVDEVTTEIATQGAETITTTESVKQKDLIKTAEVRSDLSASFQRTLDYEEQRELEIAELRRSIASDSVAVISSVIQIYGASAKAQTAFATLEILANQAIALSKAVASIKGSTGIDYIAQVASVVATVFSTFAQISNVLNQAKAQSSAADAAVASVKQSSFAEGTEYLERGNRPQGKDTIPIWANEGEAIIPTGENLKYPGLASAWIEGSLEDWIRQNYVNPSLILKGLEQGETDSALIDYSNRFYRQLIETKSGNQINKSALRYLASIDRKLNKSIPREYS